jgi:RNA polymerase sigma-70 factor (ECF subfamily)
MDEQIAAERFEGHRAHLRAVAQRMLGPTGEADDAVQQAWLRYRRADTADVANLRGWLTTVVGRICLDRLRSRAARREVPLPVPAAAARSAAGGGDLPAPAGTVADPEAEVLLAEQIGPALLVVLDRLGPAERVAFVLHDLFAVPFDEIAPVVDRTPSATKKLASRARARVRGTSLGDADAPAASTAPAPPADRARQRELASIFLEASRGGDMRALLAVLDEDVVRRAEHLELSVLRGARGVAEETKVFAAHAASAEVVLVDGRPGLLVAPGGRPLVVLRLTFAVDRITEIDVVAADPVRLAAVDLALLPDG